MFNSGYHGKEFEELPVAKPAPRFSPRIIAAIKGKPLPEYIRDRVFDDERPFPSPSKSKPTKTKKPMFDFAEQPPVMEAGNAPEGIHSTKEYHLFKLLPTNRPVEQADVRKLMAAIRVKNLLHLNPIIVNGDMEVIDGQHRLEAAKQLGVSIFFAQDDGVSMDDIAALNSNKKNWALKDYIHFYAAQGKEEYIAFDAFRKKNPALPAATLLGLVSGVGKAKRGYKDGILDISGMDTAQKVVWYLQDFSDHTKFSYTSKFIEAVAFIVRTGLYDHEHMVKKLEQNPGMLQPAATAKGWIENIERIYNFRMRDDSLVIFLKRR